MQGEDSPNEYQNINRTCIHINEGGGGLRKKPYDKRDHFNFPIVNFPFICSTIPEAPVNWSLYLSVHAIFQSMWFLSGFP
jgi:hypothetical protein